MESTLTSQLPTSDDAAMQTVAAVGRAALGFGALGVCAALGAGDLGSAVDTAPTAVVVQAGALLLTGPALLVGHQFLGLEAAVGELVGALTGAFVRTGTVALGMSPMVLFFAATSDLAPAMLALVGTGLGVLGLVDGVGGLMRAERAVGERTLQRDVSMQGLVLGWAVLTGLIGLRIAAHLGGV